MNDEKPICLSLAAGFLVIAAGWILISSTPSPGPQGSDEGYSANFGTGLIILCIMVILYCLGFFLTIISIGRREKFRAGAFICLLGYLLPPSAIGIYLFCGGH
jgi:hypothetical protein